MTNSLRPVLARHLLTLVVVLCCEAALGTATCRDRDNLRLHHIQVIGIHNSYKQNTYPNTLPAFDYGHPPLTAQLEEKHVRLFELDIYAPVPNPTSNNNTTNGEFIIPVGHVTGFDDTNTCDHLAECLAPLDAWSTSANKKDASLVVVQIEIKQEFSVAEWDIFDVICRQFWNGGQRIITPSSLQVEGLTLRESIIDGTLGSTNGALEDDEGHPGGGWPRLSTTARHAMFLLDNSYATYIADLSPRVAFPMFAASDSQDAAGQAVVLKINTPDVALIQDKVAQGYLVRTRADADVPFHRWSDTEIVTGFFNLLAADGDTVSETRLVDFLMVTGTPVSGALVGQLIAICGGSPLSLAQFNCVLAVARQNGVDALPLASSLPLGSDAYDRRDDALASGAQFVSSDYAGPAPPDGSVWSYQVSFPSGLPFACNPITTTRNETSSGSGSKVFCSDIDVNAAAAVNFRNNIFRHRGRAGCGQSISRSRSSDGSGESSDSSSSSSSSDSSEDVSRSRLR